MKSDDVLDVFRRDLDILRLGQSLFLKSNKNQLARRSYIGNSMREMARLLIQIRFDLQMPFLTIRDVLVPKRFDACIAAVKTLAGFNGANDVKSPSLVLRLGHSINKLCDLIYGQALRNDETELANNVNNFQRLMANEYNFTSRHALSQLSYDTSAKEKLPIANDIKLLIGHVDEILKNSEHPQFLDALAARITIFNRRRGAEAIKLTVRDFKKSQLKEKGLEEIEQSLTDLEHQLCRRYVFPT